MAHKIFGWALLVIPACVAPSGSSSSTSGPDATAVSPAIVGGTAVQPSQFPSVVDIEEQPGEWFCTGTLIESQWVLTAAHCLVDESAAIVNVRFGGNDISDPTATDGTVVAAAQLYINPLYAGEGAFEHDSALIQLASAVTDRTPSPIDVTAVSAGTAVTEVGYGDSDNDGDGAGTLRSLSTTTVDCNDVDDPDISNSYLLCFDATLHASCYGDSGGPAFTEAGSIAGITSGGTSDGSSTDCTGSGVWDLYTNLAAEADFIELTIAGSDGSSTTTTTTTGTAGTDPAGEGSPAVPETSDGGGCASGGGSGGGLAFAALGLIARRRRQRPLRTTSAR